MLRLMPILLFLLLAGCAFEVPLKYLPSPISNESFTDPTRAVAIPLPIVASSPNEKITTGALVAVLLHNRYDEVSTLLVPQANYNQYFGTTATLSTAFYSSPEASLKVRVSKSTTINEEYRVRYFNERFVNDRYELNLDVFRFADGSARFFGFHSESTRQHETNYTDRETGFNFSGGFRFAEHHEIAVGERFKEVDIGKGAVTSIPFITAYFPDGTVPGTEGYHVHAQKISYIYNTLDYLTMPTEGAYLRVSVENSLKKLGSSANFRSYEGEAKVYRAFWDARLVSIFRFSCDQTEGSRIPFLEQGILGGETTLRGYGQNRFIDKSYILLNLEERIRLFRWPIFTVNADWEVAPFIDMGCVADSIVEATKRSFEYNPGIGLRLVVRPNVLGRIDLGLGKDGPAVFVGLGYPF